MQDARVQGAAELEAQFAIRSSSLPASAASRIIVTSIQSLLQPVPGRDALAAATREIRVGGQLDEQEFTRWLVEHGGHATTAVELPGEFSLRGGILDIFAPDADDPVRIELFGDEVESIRRFDVATQRSLETLDAIDDHDARADRVGPRALHGYLPPATWFLLDRAERACRRRASSIWSGWTGRRRFTRCGRRSRRSTSFRR